MRTTPRVLLVAFAAAAAVTSACDYDFTVPATGGAASSSGAPTSATSSASTTTTTTTTTTTASSSASGCATECDDNGWACGTNSCGQSCGECTNGLDCTKQQTCCTTTGWRASVDGIAIGVAAANGVAYAATQAGHVVAIDACTGEVQGTAASPSGVSSRILTVDGDQLLLPGNIGPTFGWTHAIARFDLTPFASAGPNVTLPTLNSLDNMWAGATIGDKLWIIGERTSTPSLAPLWIVDPVDPVASCATAIGNGQVGRGVVRDPASMGALVLLSGSPQNVVRVTCTSACGCTLNPIVTGIPPERQAYTMTVIGDHIFVGGFRFAPTNQTSFGFIHAYSAATGVKEAEFVYDVGTTEEAFARLATDGTKLYAVGARGLVQGMETTTGTGFLAIFDPDLSPTTAKIVDLEKTGSAWNVAVTEDSVFIVTQTEDANPNEGFVVRCSKQGDCPP